MNPTSTPTARDADLPHAREVEPPPRDEHDHHARLWVSNHGHAHASEALDAFERVLGAIWACASATLGEMPLSAVFGAVFRRARARHAWMRGFSVTPSGIRYERPAHDIAIDDVRAGAHFTLVDLLRTLARCTAEILVPHLHAELARRRHVPRRTRAE